MSFAGIPFAQALMAFGAVGVLVVGLYILRLRRRVFAVPFAALWQRVLFERQAESLFSQLKRLLSLLLQLAILAMLVLALRDPRPQTDLVKGRNIVLLLDGSASMQATDVKPSRLDTARTKATEIIRAMSDLDHALLVQMDAVITPLGPRSSDRAELERMLASYTPTETRADLPRGLQFAADAVSGLDHPEIIVISDGALGDLSDAAKVPLAGAILRYVPIGVSNRNFGITQFSVRRYPLDKARYEVMLEITNASPEPGEIELKLLGDGLLVDVTKLRLNAGERLPRFYPNLSGASQKLEAVITPTGNTVDDLAADNKAFALLPDRRRVKVLDVTEGNRYLEAALLLDEYLDVTEVTPRQYVGVETSKFDVVIFDSVTPAEPPKAHALYLDPRGDGSPVKVGKPIVAPSDDNLEMDKVLRTHPIARFSTLDSIKIAKATPLSPQPGDKVVGQCRGQALLVAGERQHHKFAALGFDIRESDFALLVSWPLFVLSTLNWFTGEDEQYLSSYQTGQVWRIRAGELAARVNAIVKQPDGKTSVAPVHEGRAVILGRRSGFYQLNVEGNPPLAFAANLNDEVESKIEPSATLVLGATTAYSLTTNVVSAKQATWVILLLLVAALSALEWATYHRRVTV